MDSFESSTPLDQLEQLQHAKILGSDSLSFTDLYDLVAAAGNWLIGNSLWHIRWVILFSAMGRVVTVEHNFTSQCSL